MNSPDYKEEILNPEIIELIELGNDWNKAFPNSGTILFNVNEPTTKEQIRERLRESLNKYKEFRKSITKE